jgi:diacylglycerol O-acyltransferase/trehalose O-mycolyltransferase
MRRLSMVGVMCASLGLGLLGATGAQAEPLAPEQDPTVNNPPIAVMPTDAKPVGEFVGAKSKDGSKIVSQRGYDDLRTVDVGIKSVAMGNITIPVRVVLPPGWKKSAKKKYPVAIFLHGGNDNYKSWTRDTDVEGLAAKYNVIVVTPEGGRAAHYTNYLNKKTKQGPLQWETFHLQEMVQILGAGFRADTKRLGITGNSSGGFGSMSYPSRHPGMFKFAGVMSGPVDIQDAAMTQLILATPATDTVAEDRFGDPVKNKKNWTKHNPYALIKNLRGTSLFVSSGLTGLNRPEDADTMWTPLQLSEYLNGVVTTKFVQKLKKEKIKATIDLYELGQHNWPSWRIELAKSFPQEMKALGATRR